MCDQQPPRIIVEVASPEIVKRLEAENESLRNEIKKLREQHNSLHATVYRLMDRFVDLTRSMKQK